MSDLGGLVHYEAHCQCESPPSANDNNQAHSAKCCAENDAQCEAAQALALRCCGQLGGGEIRQACAGICWQ